LNPVCEYTQRFFWMPFVDVRSTVHRSAFGGAVGSFAPPNTYSVSPMKLDVCDRTGGRYPVSGSSVHWFVTTEYRHTEFVKELSGNCPPLMYIVVAVHDMKCWRRRVTCWLTDRHVPLRTAVSPFTDDDHASSTNAQKARVRIFVDARGI
jgi:hypothetical protein